jgi:hypothetical protein
LSLSGPTGTKSIGGKTQLGEEKQLLGHGI